MFKEIFVKLEIKDQKVAEELKRVISSMEGFHLQNLNHPALCDLLILEIGSDLEKLLDSIKTSGSAQEVFLVSSSLDAQALIQAKRAGVKKFFSQPIKKEEVRKALLESGNVREKYPQAKGSKKAAKLYI